MQQYSYQPRIEESYLILQDQWQYLPSPSIVELLHDDMELHVSKNKNTANKKRQGLLHYKLHEYGCSFNWQEIMSSQMKITWQTLKQFVKLFASLA